MHTLIVGTTGSGKTTLARIAAANNRGQPAILLDPYQDAGWQNAEVFEDTEKFLARVRETTNRLIIVDESGTQIDRYDPGHAWLAVGSRHNGHNVLFLAQRATMVSPNIRANCEHCAMFATTPKDAELLGEDFVQPAAVEFQPLPRYYFLSLDRFSPLRLYRVENQPLRVVLVKKDLSHAIRKLNRTEPETLGKNPWDDQATR